MKFDTLPIPGPEGRATAIRASLNQIAELPGAAVPLHNLGAAFARLAMPRYGDDAATATRRKTCAELSTAIEADVFNDDSCHGSSYAGVDPLLAMPWFQAQIDAWADSNDPRQRTMAATAARELRELKFTEG